MPTDIHIRRAQKRDREQLGALWMALLEEQAGLDPRFQVAGDALERWTNDFPVWLADETYRLFVAERGDALLGFATAERWGPPPIYEAAEEVYLNELYVVPGARRQSVGGQLAEAVRAWAASLEAERIRLGVLAANAAGQAFWKREGAETFTTTLTLELDGPKRDTAADARQRASRIGF